MKTAIAILLLMFFASCNTENENSANPLITSNTDTPCLQFIPIIANQTDTIGEVVIFSGSGGIAIQINELNATVNTLHIKFSQVALSGNIAPGQFPFHFPTPQIPFSAYFPWQDLGWSSLQSVYIYLHFDTDKGTAWAGTVKRQGRGQWYYYTSYNLCH